jgi:hypothetical protein
MHSTKQIRGDTHRYGVDEQFDDEVFHTSIYLDCKSYAKDADFKILLKFYLRKQSMTMRNQSKTQFNTEFTE